MKLSFSTVNFTPMFGADVALDEVLDAASHGGFTSVGLDIWTVSRHLARGGSLDGIRMLLDERGLDCTDVLALAVGRERLSALENAQQLADLAQSTGATICGVAVTSAVVDHRDPDVRRLLVQCAQRLADVGVRLAFEFLGYSPVRSVADACDICAELGWDRAGILLDSWHALTSTELTAIGALPGSAIAMVQVSDAVLPLQSDLQDGSRNLRRLPGDGNLDLHAFVRAVDATGFAGVVSPEVLSTVVRSASPVEFARDAYRAMLKLWPEQ